MFEERRYLSISASRLNNVGAKVKSVASKMHTMFVCDTYRNQHEPTIGRVLVRHRLLHDSIECDTFQNFNQKEENNLPR